jgi:hypothetical protein
MPHQKRPSALATRGSTSALRIAGTVVEIHRQHPTTSPLLSDGVRVLSRTLAKAKRGLQVVSALAHHVLRDRTRRAKRQMQQIMEAARQRGTAAADPMQTTSQHLLDITRATVQHAPRGGAVLKARAPRRARNWQGQPVTSLPIRAKIPDVGRHRECILLPEGVAPKTRLPNGGRVDGQPG